MVQTLASTGIEIADKTVLTAYVSISKNTDLRIAPFAKHLQAAVLAKVHSSASTMIAPALLLPSTPGNHTMQASIPQYQVPADVS